MSAADSGKNQNLSAVTNFLLIWTVNMTKSFRFIQILPMQQLLLIQKQRLTRSKNFINLKPFEEMLKNEIKPYLESNTIGLDLEEQDIKDLNYYLSNDLIYFNNDQYMESHLQIMMKAINIYPYLLSRKYFRLKKMYWPS
jgi:hypothetical protein